MGSSVSVNAVHAHTVYQESRIFRVGKFWRKWRLEGVFNFHRVLFSLFQGLSMETYSRVYFSVCLFLAISGRLRTKQKLNPCEKFPIYGIWLEPVEGLLVSWVFNVLHDSVLNFQFQICECSAMHHWISLIKGDSKFVDYFITLLSVWCHI